MKLDSSDAYYLLANFWIAVALIANGWWAGVATFIGLMNMGVSILLAYHPPKSCETNAEQK